MPATAKICLDGINERSGSRPIDFLVNTHHHGDHTAGNVVFKPAAKKILAQVNEPKAQLEAAAQSARNAKPGAPPQARAGGRQHHLREDVARERWAAR